MASDGRRFNDSFFARMMNYWPLLVALVGVITMITTIKNKVDEHEVRLTRIEGSMDKIQENTDALVRVLLRHKRFDDKGD